MKQYITEEQYNELPEDKKDIWFKWAVKHNYRMTDIYPLLAEQENWDTDELATFPSIGQMMEFLGDEEMDRFVMRYGETLPLNEQLCDELWEAVKAVLNK
jgi:hypothetical protein